MPATSTEKHLKRPFRPVIRPGRPFMLHPFLFRPAAAAAVVLLAACGLLEPKEDPDAPLRLKQLAPPNMVAQEVAVCAPDSGDGGAPATLRFTLAPAAWTALQEGAVLEVVVRTPASGASLEGWSVAASAWVPLATEETAAGGDYDLWWRGAWLTPSYGLALAATDRTVRIRLAGAADTLRTWVRVIRLPASGLIVLSVPAGPVAADDEELLIREGGTVWRIELPLGGRSSTVTTQSPFPDAFCRLGGFFWGATATDIRRALVTGGSWSRVTALPWNGDHLGTALTSDGEDLYLVRYPTPGTGEFPVLYHLDPALLAGGSGFLAAVTDSNDVRRNGVRTGQGFPLLWWPRERVLAVPAVQEGSYGLAAFSRVGRGQFFIPLPFQEGALQAAFVGSRLLVTGARPTPQGLLWSQGLTPVPPLGGLLFGWPHP
jgi:hypothetical protein